MRGRIVVCTVTTLLAPRIASACPVCFGATDGAMMQGSSMGIFALLVVTVGMLAAFGGFFVHLARREASVHGHVDATPSAPAESGAAQ
jgi:hypothetical protein